jgi:hypothetical protein
VLEATAGFRACFRPDALGPPRLIMGVRRLLPRNDMLCDACQKREATIHNTEIDGDVTRHSNFCDSCFEASQPTEARDLTAALQNGCRFCGGEPYAGGHAPPTGLSGAFRMSFMCKPCTEEYYRLLDQKLPGFVACASTATVSDELIAKVRACGLSAVFTELENHMTKWVAEKNSL